LGLKNRPLHQVGNPIQYSTENSEELAASLAPRSGERVRERVSFLQL
jgi:hypothetical protein